MYNYQNVLDRITQLENKLQAIYKNPDLSMEGREKAKRAWAAEKAAAYNDAVIYLQADIARLRREFADNEAARERAAANAAKYWDYGRLQYELVAINALLPNITNAGSIALRGWDVVTEFAKQYAAVVQSQDKHKRRAWCEVAIPYFETHHQDDPKAIQLVLDLRRDLNELLTTPEIAFVNSEGAKLAELAVKIVDAVNVARRYYVDGLALALGSGDPFGAMLEGITIKRGPYDGEKDRFEITVTVDTTTNTSAG